MFTIKNLTFSYEEGPQRHMVLHDISLHIPKGEWWSIIGANGSGKSTLARHLNGLLVGDTGQVLVDGLDASRPEYQQEIRRRVGIVFQNPDNQIIGNSIEEDVAFGPENMGIPPQEIRQRIQQALAQVGLSGMEKQDPNLLSGGQKQRVAIAGALAMQPEALILDESTAMLDPQGCEEVFAVLKKLHQNGMTIVMITHHMAEVAWSDRVAVLSEGCLRTTGTPAEIFAQTDRLKQWHIELPVISQIGQMLLEQGVGQYLPGRTANISAAMSVEALAQALVEGRKTWKK